MFSRRLPPLLLLSLIVASQAVEFAKAQESTAIKGALLAKKGDGGWEPLRTGVPVPKERLLVSLFESELKSPNGAVDIKLVGSIGEIGPLPSFESAVLIHENPKVDLDITLERGVLVLTNKKKGIANVDLHIRGRLLKVALLEPETKLGVDLYARHAPGRDSLKADDPTIFVFMLNVKGSSRITYNENTIALKEPPGPALLRWDSALHEPDVQHLEKLPDWIKPSPEELKTIEQINRAAKSLADGDARAAFLKLLFSEDPIERKVGLTAVGALGTPLPLFVALQKSKHADARQFAILVIRNWLGQDSGQLKKLETAFSGLGLTKTDVESLMHLLLGFDDEDRQNPATFQVLIEGLKHSKLLVRELSYWHLTRLAPAGASIAYDPAGSPEAIQTAVERWRQLIPPGKMPPSVRK